MKTKVMIITSLLVLSVFYGAAFTTDLATGEYGIEEEHEIRVMKPLISVPQIRERGQTVDIWVRNPNADADTIWEASLSKEYAGGHVQGYELDIIGADEAEHRPGEHNWYVTALIPEEAKLELYDLELSDGTVNTKSIQSVSVVEEISDEFNFVKIADTHIGATHGEGSITYTRRFIDEMNLVRPDFIVLTGDVCDKEPTWWASQDPYPSEQDEMFFELIQELEVPIYVVHGNHDYSYTNTDDPEYDIRSYQKWINPHLNYTFDYGDYHFIMQNSGKYVTIGINSDGQMTMDNVTWMEQKLSENMDKTMRIVGMHHSVYPDRIHDDEVRDAFRQAVIDHNVSMVLTGHTHTPTIYDAYGGSVPDDPTQGEQPLHVTTGDLVKSAREYRLIRIHGDEIASMTYDLNGDGVRDPAASMPLGEITMEYHPENDGSSSEVTATIVNDLYEYFDDALVTFTVPSPEPGHRYEVTNGTIQQEIDAGEFKIFYVRTDIDADSTKEVSIDMHHYIDTLPAVDVGRSSATLMGSLPQSTQGVDAFFRYRRSNEEVWTQVDLGTSTGPQELSIPLDELTPLNIYEFKAGVSVENGEVLGEIMIFVTGDKTRTTQLGDGWLTNHYMEGLEVDLNDLALESHELTETYSFTGEMEVIPVSDFTHMEVEMFGAGGGGAVHGGDWVGAPGGDGGYLNAIFDVSDFDELHVYVGEGGVTGDGSSTTINPGGWGASHGGASLDDTYTYGSPHAGAGGGSTEIVGVMENGTEVWLAAADAGGGGGEVEDISMIGVSDRSIGGGGGGAGGQGGDIHDDSGWGHGEAGQSADDGQTPRTGQGYGGAGGDADRDHDGEYMAWPGGPGGYDFNQDHIIESIEAEVGGHFRSGGRTNYNPNEQDPIRNGEHGSINARYIDLSTETGVRISDPIYLEDIGGVEDSLITWTGETPGDSSIEVYTAITEGEEPQEDDWIRVGSGDPIPGLEDPEGKYLWTKQVFILGGSTSPPRLTSISEAILETGEVSTMDIELYGERWNFVSFNLELHDTDLVAILEDPDHGISGSYESGMYHHASHGWLSYVPDREEHFDTLQTWDHTMGVWIRMTVDDVLTVWGSEPETTTLYLEPGWNMVGMPGETAGNHGLPEEVTKVGYFHETAEYHIAYDHEPEGFVFQPGQGYWIYNGENETVEWTM